MFTLCMSRGPPAPPALDACGRTVAANKQVKGGYLLRYRRGFFCRGWSEEWVVLYEDSTLAWYAEKGAGRARGCVRLRDAPELLAVGEWTRRAPRRPPRLPRSASVAQLLAVAGRAGRRGPAPPDVHWLVGRSAADINDWMTAISNTLPPPPHFPLDNKRLSLPTMYTDTKFLANGGVNTGHYQSNGCATIIPNGNVPHETVPVAKPDNRPIAPTTTTTAATATQNKSTNRNFDDDHTVLAGVVIDWGHGWGWNQAAFDNAACTHDPAVTTSTVYCHSGDDYAIGGMDEVDWCTFGDFSF